MNVHRPYGYNRETDQWMERSGYKLSKGAHCLHWVSKGRCGVQFCDHGHLTRQYMDHVSGWIRKSDGERLLLCQPYQFSDIRRLAADCECFGLEAMIHGNGWYGHGTVTIELRPRKP